MIMYHWWSEETDYPPHLNLRTPLIHSIATLRGTGCTDSVIVMDVSEKPQSFNGWDRKLNFSVLRWKPILHTYQNKPGWKNLSRLFDIHEFCTTVDCYGVIYCDTDVFWLKNPYPLLQDPNKFCFNGYNSGFFYFDIRSPDVSNFFELFKAFTLTALNDDNFRVITRSYTDYNEWYYVLDETILTYMGVKMPHLFNFIDINEHLTPHAMKDIHTDASQAKMVHCHGTNIENHREKEEWRKKYNRGLAPLIIKELYDNMKKALGDEVDTLYEGFNFKQVSLFDKKFLSDLMATKNKDGLYNLIEAVQRD